jgi:hypothetical protein
MSVERVLSPLGEEGALGRATVALAMSSPIVVMALAPPLTLFKIRAQVCSNKCPPTPSCIEKRCSVRFGVWIAIKLHHQTFHRLPLCSQPTHPPRHFCVSPESSSWLTGAADTLPRSMTDCNVDVIFSNQDEAFVPTESGGLRCQYYTDAASLHLAREMKNALLASERPQLVCLVFRFW